MKKIISSLLGLILVFGFVGVVRAAVNSVTPSTNDINRTSGWAHVDQLSQGVGTVDLNFISTRSFWSCFEYRTDGDTSQIISENGGKNYNSGITDGLYPYFCENNSSEHSVIAAHSYVEVRMVFGAENDERFDWTRFDVLPVPPVTTPTDMNQCKKDGWKTFSNPSFKNQGSCVSYVQSNEHSGKR